MLSAALLCGPVRAADQPANAGEEEAVRGSYVGEAADAVVGRVFGVEGRASDIMYHEYDFTTHTPASAAMRSLIIPGWGQSFNGQRTKGIIFFITTVGAAIGGIKLYDKSTRTHREYRNRGVRDDSIYDDYESQRTRAFALGGVAAVLWTAGVIDAYRHAYSRLYSKEASVDVVFVDDGAQITLKKSF